MCVLYVANGGHVCLDMAIYIFPATFLKILGVIVDFQYKTIAV